jgi:transcriptional regulator with XRE-family HTH domain
MDEKKRKIAESIKTKLRMLMNEKNLTYEKLAEEADMSADTVKRFFRVKNESIPDYLTLANLANLFGVSPDYLTGFYTKEREAIVYLKHLLIAVNKLGLEVESNNDNLCIKCNDPKIMMLLRTAMDNDRYDLDKHTRILFFHGKAISEADFWDMKKKFYLYGEFVELEGDEATIDEYIEKVDEVIRDMEDISNIDEKLDEWEKTAGHPILYISEFYFDTIYNKYEPNKPTESK